MKSLLRGCLCDNLKPSFLPRLNFNWCTFSRRITARWWRQWAKNQMLTNQNSRKSWCQIVRRTICSEEIALIVSFEKPPDSETNIQSLWKLFSEFTCPPWFTKIFHFKYFHVLFLLLSWSPTTLLEIDSNSGVFLHLFFCSRAFHFCSVKLRLDIQALITEQNYNWQTMLRVQILIAYFHKKVFDNQI